MWGTYVILSFLAAASRKQKKATDEINLFK